MKKIVAIIFIVFILTPAFSAFAHLEDNALLQSSFSELGISPLDIEVLSGNYTYSDNVLTITQSGQYIINMSSGEVQNTTDRIAVAASVTADITLNNVNIDKSGETGSTDENCAFLMGSNANVTLRLVDTNELKSGQYKAGIQVPSGAVLTITSDSLGSLVATGNTRSAGIGSSSGIASGTVNISGNAQVTATGGANGAGIGGSQTSGAGTININGDAKVTAVGGASGAGIGSGGSSAGVINIGGNAQVTATGGSGYSGIGGLSGTSGDAINIDGTARITATGGSGGAGIGGIAGASLIRISGDAQVTATGTSGGAGIGTPINKTACKIEISDNATVIASGGTSGGSGIGVGALSSGAPSGYTYIDILDNAKVYAQGGTSGAAGIGSGYVNSTTIKFYVNVTVGNGEDNPTVVAYGGNAFSGRFPVAIGSSGYTGTNCTSNITIKSGSVSAKAQSSGVNVYDIGKRSDMMSSTSNTIITGGSVYAVNGRVSPSPTNGAEYGSQTLSCYLREFPSVGARISAVVNKGGKQYNYNANTFDWDNLPNDFKNAVSDVLTADSAKKAWVWLPSEPTEFYSCTVQQGDNGTAKADTDFATAGTEINISAVPNQDYFFHEWQAVGGDISIADSDAAETSLIMPESNATVIAIFSDSAPLPKEATPTAEIDYFNEILTGLNGYYYINGSASPQWISDDCIIEDNWFGTTVSIVKKGDGLTTRDSMAQQIEIPARPDQPNGITGVNVTIRGYNDGKITGVTTAMEYRKSTTLWADVTGTEITELSPGSYYVRFKYTATSFRSEQALVVIEEGPTPSIGFTANGVTVTFGRDDGLLIISAFDKDSELLNAQAIEKDSVVTNFGGEAAKRIKVLLWEDFETIKPLESPETIIWDGNGGWVKESQE